MLAHFAESTFQGCGCRSFVRQQQIECLTGFAELLLDKGFKVFKDGLGNRGQNSSGPRGGAL